MNTKRFARSTDLRYLSIALRYWPMVRLFASSSSDRTIARCEPAIVK